MILTGELVELEAQHAKVRNVAVLRRDLTGQVVMLHLDFCNQGKTQVSTESATGLELVYAQQGHKWGRVQRASQIKQRVKTRAANGNGCDTVHSCSAATPKVYKAL